MVASHVQRCLVAWEGCNPEQSRLVQALAQPPAERQPLGSPEQATTGRCLLIGCGTGVTRGGSR
ncbi:hypothetical protein BKA56DRAFT_582428 [Ilyonectria sp. MPI-CAGE-AT-0026]|nr:hypothetical protein BKA56DRAFT_582428 [Ilyonectria sp. MPI-CAGE-AT-0026]